MMGEESQKEAFLQSEGDAWFARNSSFGGAETDHVDEAILEALAQSNSILEVGCADGRRLASIARLIPRTLNLVGIDPSSNAIEEGMRRCPSLDLRVGTADALPDEAFDAVLVGFCLYLCDRHLLPRVVSEIDRVLLDGGTLVIVDFDPPNPRRRRYRHLDGLWSYKMDYSSLFTTFPQFVLSSKRSMSHTSATWESDETERIAVWSLRKDLGGGYLEEYDD